MDPEQSTSTYAAKTAKNTKPTQNFPKKDQAIVINAIEELQILDYVKAVGNIIGPKSILFASKISNNRICLYLENKQYVDQIIEQNQTIKINDDHTISIRRLITPATRIILSNVCPSIPNQTLEKALLGTGMKIVSPISFLRAGIQDQEYAHILSFRRQVYITPDETTIPDSLMINYEDTEYRVFLSGENIKCFKCNELGHPASKCPKSITINREIPARPKRPAPDNNEDTQDNNTNKKAQNNPKTKKIQEELSNPDEIDGKQNPEQSKKKSKKQDRGESPASQIPIEELLSPVKDEINKNPEKYVLDYETFKELLENVQGSNEHLSIVQEYTGNVTDLMTMLKEIYPFLKHRQIKNRFTRLQTKLRIQLTDGNYDNQSQTSQSNDYDNSMEQ